MDDRGRRINELKGDPEAVREYGKRFPDTWVGIKFDGDRLVAVFTDPDAHRAAIAALVAHPDRVDVRAPRRSEREVKAILGQVVGLLESSGAGWSSYGPSLDVVHVELHGNGEDVARELHGRFGDGVELTVGAFPFPFPDARAPAAPQPAPQSTMQISAAGLRAIPDSQVVTVGQPVAGFVEITNTAPDEVLVLHTDRPLHGQLLDRRDIVNTAIRPVAGTGLSVELRPGEYVRIPFHAEADSRDLRAGPTLAPGRYQLVVTIPLHSLAGGALRDQQLVTPPIPIDIVAAGGH